MSALLDDVSLLSDGLPALLVMTITWWIIMLICSMIRTLIDWRRCLVWRCLAALWCSCILLYDAHRLGVVMMPTLLHDMHGDAQPVDDACRLGEAYPSWYFLARWCPPFLTICLVLMIDAHLFTYASLLVAPFLLRLPVVGNAYPSWRYLLVPVQWCRPPCLMLPIMPIMLICLIMPALPDDTYLFDCLARPPVLGAPSLLGRWCP